MTTAQDGEYEDTTGESIDGAVESYVAAGDMFSAPDRMSPADALAFWQGVELSAKERIGGLRHDVEVAP